MKIAIVVKLVPDLVEELAIDSSGASFDYDWLRFKLNELDDHAIEEGLLLKERYGGQVSVIAFENEVMDEALFTASAKGVDQLLRISGVDARIANNHTLIHHLIPVICELQPDLVLTGVQAHSDLDGSIGSLLAEGLGYPYIGYVSGVAAGEGDVMVRKEFPGGLIAEMSVKIPVVLGIQSAEHPPRYVAFSKIRQAMKTAALEDISAAPVQPTAGAVVDRMFQPEATTTAEMIEGSVEVVADRLVNVIKELGLI